MRWSYLVVDEAQRLKNTSSVLFDALGTLGARRRLLLSGTPLQVRTSLSPTPLRVPSP